MATLEQMVERQRVLAQFGELALRSQDLQEVLTEACRLVRVALGTDLAKVLEIQRDGHCLFMRAGIGWNPGYVGHTRLPMGERSSETYAIEQRKPIITQDIGKEERFQFPNFMKEHGIVALVNVPIFLPGDKPYGLLQVDSRTRREFGEQDIEFLRTYATILGPVIDRLHKVHDLQLALETNNRLLAELEHRVKNNIAVIVGLVRMRATETDSEEARTALNTVCERIETLRMVHEQLHSTGKVDRLQLRPYITELVENLIQLHEGRSRKIQPVFQIAEVELSPEKAAPLGLIVNEFVTNSLKYAFADEGGTISILVEALGEQSIAVRLRDNGKGLPNERRPSPSEHRGGMSIIAALARQIGAEPYWSSSGGTALRLQFAMH